nr:helix-turn-helix transcriptional regulator [Desulfitobacterium chlororespirans]
MQMNQVRKARKALGITQEELSFRSGVPQPEISRIERGIKKKIELETGLSLSRALGVPAEELFPDYGLNKRIL